MARSSKVEPCMFCGALPCECGGPPKRAVKKRAVKYDTMTDKPDVVDVQLPEPKSGMRDAMKATASLQQANLQPKVEALDDEQKGALAVLLAADILHPDEVEKYQPLVTPKDRIAAWKERRRRDGLGG